MSRGLGLGGTDRKDWAGANTPAQRHDLVRPEGRFPGRRPGWSGWEGVLLFSAGRYALVVGTDESGGKCSKSSPTV